MSSELKTISIGMLGCGVVGSQVARLLQSDQEELSKRSGAELGFYIDQFKKILSPETGAYKGVGGFKSMGSVFSGNGWDWEHFWTITAFFSIVLAFMNLLPIPALDGGHVLFTLIEMITGRKPNDKFLEYAQIVGMVLLLGLMLYANGNDWFGWGK